MSESVATETVEAPATETPEGGAPETSPIEDAFSDYFHNPTEGKTDKPETEEPEAEPPKEEGSETEEPEKEPEKKDPFETAFFNENGEVDVNKMTSFSFDGLDFASNQKESNNGNPEVVEPKQPEWKTRYEEDKLFKDNINKQTLGPLQDAFAEIGKLQIPEELKPLVEQAFNAVYAKVDKGNKEFFAERDAQRNYEKQENASKEAAERERMSKMPELAKSNANLIINSLPGDDAGTKSTLYNRIMFGPGAGAEMFEDILEMRHPDLGSKSKDEIDKLKIGLVNEIQSDGKRLQRFFTRAFNSLRGSPENFKRAIGKAAAQADSDARNNAMSAQKSPSGSVQREPKTGNGVWDGYFADPGSKIRV